MREDKNNPRWKGGRSCGYVLKKAKESWELKNLSNLCEKCGLIKGKIFHHIDKNRSNNVPKNILFVCFGCHNLIHDRGRKGNISLNGKKCIVCKKELRGKQRKYCSYACFISCYYSNFKCISCGKIISKLGKRCKSCSNTARKCKSAGVFQICV